MTLLAVAVMVLLPGLWMLVGVWDNWRHPTLNRETVAQVMGLTRMEAEYPEQFSHVAYRRVTSDRLISSAFGAVVLWETLATILLLAGAGMLGLAAFAASDFNAARNVALAGALVFTSNWAAFLIGGNFFCYYFCHFEGQFTHFLLAIWGSIVVVLLVLI